MKLKFDDQKVKDIVEKISADGAKKLHILSDFDKTLTRVSYIKGKPVGSLIGQLRAGGYLSPEYAPESYKLFEKYSPFENDHTISLNKKLKKMEQWWEKHHELLIRCKLNKNDMDQVMKTAHLKLRPGVKNFFKLLHKHKIPIVIISAGPAYMIEKMLKNNSLLTKNIHIVANYYNFDKNGYMTSVKKPIIHSLNKYEIILKNLPFFDQLKQRTNVILLGDQPDDLGMIKGFEYDNLLTIAFSQTEKDRQRLAKEFNVALGGNDKFNFVNDIIKKIL